MLSCSLVIKVDVSDLHFVNKKLNAPHSESLVRSVCLRCLSECRALKKLIKIWGENNVNTKPFLPVKTHQLFYFPGFMYFNSNRLFHTDRHCNSKTRHRWAGAAEMFQSSVKTPEASLCPLGMDFTINWNMLERLTPTGRVSS